MGAGVIDPATGTLYVNSASPLGHQIFALSVLDGSTRANFPVNVTAALSKQGKTLLPYYQYQRGGLQFFSGKVVAAYGLNNCDYPGGYHGTVIEVDPSTAQVVADWQSRSPGAGIWGQGGITSDGVSLFVATGNAKPVGMVYGDSESVIRFGPDLSYSASPSDFYAPANWKTLDKNDTDLGGTAPVSVEVPTGTGKYVPLIVGFGKDGNAYILNRAYLGGVGGQAVITPVSDYPIISAPAVLNTPNAVILYIPAHFAGKNNLTAIKLSYDKAVKVSILWRANYDGQFAPGTPIITTTDGVSSPIVWSIYGGSGENGIVGTDALTGKTIVVRRKALVDPSTFLSMIAVDNHIWVVSNYQLSRFTITTAP